MLWFNLAHNALKYDFCRSQKSNTSLIYANRTTKCDLQSCVGSGTSEKFMCNIFQVNAAKSDMTLLSAITCWNNDDCLRIYPNTHCVEVDCNCTDFPQSHGDANGLDYRPVSVNICAANDTTYTIEHIEIMPDGISAFKVWTMLFLFVVLIFLVVTACLYALRKFRKYQYPKTPPYLSTCASGTNVYVDCSISNLVSTDQEILITNAERLSSEVQMSSSVPQTYESSVPLMTSASSQQQSFHANGVGSV